MLNVVKTSRLSLRSNLKNASLFLFAFVLMVPLVGAFPGLDTIESYVCGYLIPSQVVIVATGAVLLGMVYFVSSGERALGARRVAMPVLMLFCCMVPWGLVRALLSSGSVQRVLMQALWMIVPLLFAIFLIGLVKKRGLRFSEFSEIVVITAALFSCVVIAYNFATYGLNLANGRLYCPGLGSVALGYTNALVIALALSRKGASTLIPAPFLFLSVVVLLVSVLLTGSRGGMYPALALALIYFLPTKNAAATTLVVLGAVIVLLLSNPIEAFLSGRAGNLQSGRYATWDAAYAAFLGGSPLDRLLGYGLGNVFPFQDWYTNYYTGHIERELTDGAWNSFSFHGNTMLVEPHNTYVWLLLEGGALSLVGFVTCLISSLLSSGLTNKISKLRFGTVLVTFMVLGIFDAIVFANAASAFWWGVLFIAFEASVESEGEPA